jgi:hypothetical protein
MAIAFSSNRFDPRRTSRRGQEAFVVLLQSGGHVLYRDDGAVRVPPVPRGRMRAAACKRCMVGRPPVSWAWADSHPILASLLDYLVQLLSFLFLQRAETPYLANRNKEAVGVALSHFFESSFYIFM